MTIASIGFIGLGDMGGAMVRGMCASDLSPTVFDLSTERVDAAVDIGATAAGSLADVAEADIVGICVATDDQARAVMGDLLPHLRAGSVISLHSTLLPDTVLWIAEQAATRDIAVVEAPVAGGSVAATEGRLTMFLAGDDTHLARIEPLVDACAALRIPAGDLGKANLLKLCTNLHTYAIHMATNEAVLLAKALGVPVDGVVAAMDANGNIGESTRNYLVLHQLEDEQLDDPGLVEMRSPQIAVIAKDVKLMEAVAETAGFDVRVAGLVGELVEDTYRMPGRIR